MKDIDKRFVIEYHLVEGKYVGRLCDSKEHMDKLVDGFSGSRRGVHDFVNMDEETGKELRIIIPLEQVKVMRAYSVDAHPEESEG